jgi:hypothetical protein
MIIDQPLFGRPAHRYGKRGQGDGSGRVVAGGLDDELCFVFLLFAALRAAHPANPGRNACPRQRGDKQEEQRANGNEVQPS